MGLLRLAHVFTTDWDYLTHAASGPGSRRRLLWVGMRLFAKSCLGFGGSGPVEERFLGLRVTGFSTRMLKFFFREIFIHGDYDFAAAREDPLILDGGANIGMATLYFTWRYPKAEVHAFEPDPDTFALLKQNLETNGLTRAHAHQVALAGKSGRVTLFRDESDPGYPSMSTVESRMPKDATMVDAVALSAFLDRQLPGREVDLLKLDIEGAEESVIRELASSGALARVRELIVEYHHHIGDEPSKLGSFLGILEHTGFCYQLRAKAAPLTAGDRFQDVLLHCYRRDEPVPARVAPREA
jgi:FkbM family methyltransferase